LAVLFLDLDHFKRINDTLGHAIGDKLIQMAAKRFKELLFETDTITRIGGDEFMILLTGLENPSKALKIAEKIFQVFETPFYIEGHELFMTCSIGVSVYPNDGLDMETLLKNADTAMNRCKEKGRNSYQLYSPKMNDKFMFRLKLENNLRHALEDNQLKLHYQPQIDAKTGKPIAIEALLRWHHPDLGLIQPNDFIPIAEESGLMVQMGEWVIQTACRQLVKWEEIGFEKIKMAVNLSAIQIKSSDFVQRVVQIMNEEGVDSKNIEFELTEGAIMEDIENSVKVLRDLRDQGIGIAIDDFGTDILR